MEQNIVFITLIIVLALFIWGRVRHDFVALLSLFILVIAGIVSPAQAFEGFGHPAVVTVAAVLIIGKALEFSGLIDLLGKWVMKVGSNRYVQIFTLSVLVAVASAFMNNVGALAIMMPVAILTAKKGEYSPSILLMPLAFASLLGGMITLIGTPPNIIIATFRAEALGEAFGMFSFAPVGIGVTIVGILFITFIGWKILPNRAAGKSNKDLFAIDDYITEVLVKKTSKILGMKILELKDFTGSEVQVLAIVRKKIRLHAPNPKETIIEGDILILETDAEDLKAFLDSSECDLIGNQEHHKEAVGDEDITIAETVVMPDSMLIGNTVAKIKLRNQFGLNLLAVARRETKIHKRLDKIVFRPGDVLLLQGKGQMLEDTIPHLGCLPLAQRDLRLGSKRKIALSLSIFITSIIIVVAGLLPVQISFSIAALAMILSGVMPIKDVYHSVDWPVIVLLGAMLPVGAALETTGGAEMIANQILIAGESFPIWATLAVIITVTMVLSGVINNAATVVLMAPIGISIANGMGVSADPFLMTIAVGASAAFLTPIGHQSNTLVMGPGGYTFVDYIKMGLPLTLLMVLATIPLVLYFWSPN